MSITTAKDKNWYNKLCENGCQFCGIKLEGPHNGLQFSHIVSKTDGGTHEEGNCLALCPECADTLDYDFKRMIYLALKKYCNGEVPESWKNAEGRSNPNNTN